MLKKIDATIRVVMEIEVKEDEGVWTKTDEEIRSLMPNVRSIEIEEIYVCG